METKLHMYHYQEVGDPFAKHDTDNIWMPTALMKDIMDAYNEYISDKEEN